jgi:hypothetical protein
MASRGSRAEEAEGQSISKKDYPIVLSPGKPRNEDTAPVQKAEVIKKTPEELKAKEIADLEKEIAYDQQQYDLAIKHPTDTAQFRNALAKAGEKLEKKKAKLEALKK